MRRVLPLGVVCLSACGGSPPASPSPPPSSTPSNATAPAIALTILGPDVVMTGSIVPYKATATLANGGTISNISSSAEWDSDNHAAATIESNAVLTGHGQGTTTITATYRGKSATVAVRVLIDTAAKVHLDALLQTMEAYSTNRATINWASFRAQVFAAAGAARTIAETYPAIRLALNLLNDYESFYIRSDREPIGGATNSCGAAPPTTPTLPATVGYVKVERCSCQTAAEITQFADALQRAIRTADRPDVIGWIVDLRGNAGGNMWPMLAGIGPVLGDGIVGWIVYNDREYEREYRAGAATSFGEVFARVQAPYTLLKEFPKVAVLTDGSVASAGEAIVVFFRGRPETRSFGTPTCGHHHLLQEFPLSDGATLVLTTAQGADRVKTKYGGPINPDETIADQGEAVERAVAWLLGGR